MTSDKCIDCSSMVSHGCARLKLAVANFNLDEALAMPGALEIRRHLGLSSYTTLRRKVEETLLIGQRKIEALKVQTYWETGRLIDEYVRIVPPGKERAEYGKEVMTRLAEDLEIDKTILYRCLKFAQYFPKVAARQLLSWAHYRALITVDDPEKRVALAKLAAQEKLTSRELEMRVHEFHLTKSAQTKLPEPLTVPKLGPFYTYRLLRPEIIHPVRRPAVRGATSNGVH